jgi:hypothetical protein
LLKLQSIAKDRFWFGDDYTPFTSVLGAPLVCTYTLGMTWNDPSSCSIRDGTGQQLAYFRYASDGKQFALRLSGPPVGPKLGPAPLSPSNAYNIKVTWPDDEQYRWVVYKSLLNAQAASGDNSGLEVRARARVAPESSPEAMRSVQEEQNLSEMFARAMSLVEHETRDSLMFPQLHEAVQSAVGWAIPSLRFNYEDTEDGLNNQRNTSVMGDFVCTNRNCPKPGWSSNMVPVWIRGYGGHRPGRYNAVVFNQRCSLCNRLGTLTLDEKSYVERISYWLCKWAGAAVTRPVYAGLSRGPHVEELCEGCKHGHCSRSQNHEDD